MTDRLTSRHLAALGCFGLLVLALQVGWIFATSPEKAAHYSFSLLSATFAFEVSDLSELMFGSSFALSCLLLSTVASAALVLPLSAGIRNLQRLLLCALLLLSLGWQVFTLSQYLQGLFSTPTLLLLLGGLVLGTVVLMRSRPPAKLWQAWAIGLGMATVFLAICILITIRLASLISGKRDELTQAVLVLLLSLTLMGWALRLRDRAEQQGQTSLQAAFLFQLWLVTIFMPTPGYFAHLD